MNEPLIFDIALGRTKPFNMTNSAIRCPFCDVENLTNILDKKGHMIWLMNKYPVLKNTQKGGQYTSCYDFFSVCYFGGSCVFE